MNIKLNNKLKIKKIKKKSCQNYQKFKIDLCKLHFKFLFFNFYKNNGKYIK